MNVLVIAPHPDDESIGCGGTLASHASKGDRVVVVFLTSGELGIKQLPPERVWAIRESEAQGAAQVLGIASLSFLRRPDWFVGENVVAAGDALRMILQREQPGLIYAPHALEWHPDHKASLPVLTEAMKGLDLEPPTIRTYEVWTPLGDYEHVEDISAFMDLKLAAVRCYRSQLVDLHYDRAIEGLNRYRGEITARCQYAEVFGTGEMTD